MKLPSLLVVLSPLLLALPLAAQFGPAVSYANNNPPKLDAGDLDGDGDPDVLTGTASPNCAAYLNTAGTFAPAVLLPQVGNPTDVKIADFDGLNNLDYVAIVSPTQLAVHLSAGPFPAYAPPMMLAVPGNAFEVEVADLDLDGDQDIAVACQNLTNGDLLIFENFGGTFGLTWAVTTAEIPTGFVTGNLTSRRGKDLIYSGAGPGAVHVLTNLATGTMSFGPELPFPVGLRPNAMTTGDFNGDGVDDVAVANGDPSIACSVLLNEGLGTTGWPNTVNLLPYTGYTIPGTSVYFGIVDEDFDCDGDLDLALAGIGNNVVGVLFNDGAGNFGSPVTHPTGTNCSDLVSANFDGGGFDVVSANANDISVLLNISPFGECHHTFIGGIRDSFVNPLPNTVEDVCPSAAVNGFLGALPRSDFDDNNTNEHFGHSFMNLPGNILSATVTVVARANGGANNDSLRFGIDPSGNLNWGDRFSTMSGLAWNAPDQATFTFDLEELPGCIDIMRKMQTEGRFDVTAQDDTAIDYIQLDLVTCGPRGPTQMLDHTPYVAFSPVTYTCTADPGAVVIFYIDLTVGAGPLLPGFGGWCLPAPTMLGFDVVPAGGTTATFSFTMPGIPPCTTLSTQALHITLAPTIVKWSNTMTQQTFF